MCKDIKPQNIAVILDDIAILTQLANSPLKQHKAAQFSKAAQTIKNLTYIDQQILQNLVKDKDNGIGPKIASVISEIMDIGTCSVYRQSFKRHKHLLNLVRIDGIGIATAQRLRRDFNAKSRKDIIKLIRDGKIKNKRIAEGVSRKSHRIPYNIAKNLADSIVVQLQTQLIDLDLTICGSLRRKQKDIGDIDIVVRDNQYPQTFDVVARLFDVIDGQGNNKICGNIKGVHVDFRFCNASNYGAMLLYLTGNSNFNIGLRTKAKKHGWTLNEYGLFDHDERIAGQTELEIFKALHIGYINPEDRS